MAQAQYEQAQRSWCVWGVFTIVTSFTSVTALESTPVFLQGLAPGRAQLKRKGAQSRTRKVGSAAASGSQLWTRRSTCLTSAAPRADQAHHKVKEQSAEDTYGSGSEEDYSDSEDEGADGYKKGEGGGSELYIKTDF